MTATLTALTSTDTKIATLSDGAAYLASYQARYKAVAGRASILREALRRIESEIKQIHSAVDAEDDGAEELYALLPALRIERDRIALRLDPIAREEQDALTGIASYGIRLG